MYTEDEIVELLSNCLEQQTSLISIFENSDLEGFICSPDNEIRALTAKALAVDSSSETALSYLCRLASDPDPSVRVEAIDSLSEYCCTESFQILRRALHDSDWLVRGYAVFGVAYIGQTVSPAAAQELLLHLERTEIDEFVVVSIYEGLYILGIDCYIEKLFTQFGSDDYHIQCAVLHALTEILSAKNAKQIIGFLKSIAQVEFPRSVAILIEKLGNQCCCISDESVRLSSCRLES